MGSRDGGMIRMLFGDGGGRDEVDEMSTVFGEMHLDPELDFFDDLDVSSVLLIFIRLALMSYNSHY